MCRQEKDSAFIMSSTILRASAVGHWQHLWFVYLAAALHIVLSEISEFLRGVVISGEKEKKRKERKRRGVGRGWGTLVRHGFH